LLNDVNHLPLVGDVIQSALHEYSQKRKLSNTRHPAHNASSTSSRMTLTLLAGGCMLLLDGALYLRRRATHRISRTSLPLRCFLDVRHRVRRLAVSLTVIYLNLADSLCYFDSILS